MNIIKNSIIEQFSGTVSSLDILVSLIFAFVISIYIIIVYRKTFTGVIYSKAFSMSLMMLAMVTALIIRTISSNLALSLGMVGALSIVRFRTAVKEPIDTAFMFWAISAGIMTGAGLYLISVIASFLLGILFFVGHMFGFKVNGQYLLIIRYQGYSEEEIMKIVRSLKKHNLKTDSLINGVHELTFEIELSDKERSIVDRISAIPGVLSASVISYQNDFGV